ncbi:hypothetical protein [Neobacillus sp. SuZ13]|uniref:hypothetical protein n=1 Tax=Neobacillus sp. SuZ13 TaxID=3047875 RepID=UPI0024C042C7|nr:hypothetical protein [Neobacillus sp. SuZ13]WHY64661.1 hypothetical protein QNH17_16165 [Neobacillus sp. SuZ13]
MAKDKIIYSKITGKRMPPYTVSFSKEPNIDRMAQAIIDLYYQTREYKKDLDEKER